MTRKEINEWIDDVNNGTGNPNRPPELKAGSEPCSEGIFSLNCEEIGPKNNGELQVGTALDKGNPLNEIFIIQARSGNEENKGMKANKEQDK